MRRFIILVTLVVIAVTAGTIYIGSRTFEGTLVERPYETGLAWDEVQKRQARLGWRVDVEQPAIKEGEDVVVLRLADRRGAPLDGATMDVTLSRPSTGTYDRTYRAISLGGGRYQVALSVPLGGIWDLRATVSRGEERYSSTVRIVAAERTRR